MAEALKPEHGLETLAIKFLSRLRRLLFHLETSTKTDEMRPVVLRDLICSDLAQPSNSFH